MSKESVQFIEMIREAASRRKPHNVTAIRQYCYVCGKETEHRLVSNRGEYELYACETPNCPHTASFRVK